MSLDKYGSVWQIDHCLLITSFNLLGENDMKKCFNWTNLRPMYSNKNIVKGSKIDNRLYLMLEVRDSQFSILNEEGLNQNFMMKFIASHQ